MSKPSLVVANNDELSNAVSKWLAENPESSSLDKVSLTAEEFKLLQAVGDDPKLGLTAANVSTLSKLPSLDLFELLRGSKVSYPAFEREFVEDPAQEKRKRRIKERVAEREYQRMVANVDTNMLKHQQRKNSAGVTLKTASFGLHMIVGMICGFAVGYVVSYPFGSKNAQLIGGTVGMVGTLLVEIILYILREDRKEKWEKRQMKRSARGGLVSAGES